MDGQGPKDKERLLILINGLVRPSEGVERMHMPYVVK